MSDRLLSHIVVPLCLTKVPSVTQLLKLSCLSGQQETIKRDSVKINEYEAEDY